MAIKLLINGIAGAGKTSLLSSLDKTAFVVSRDAKKFGLKLPHMLVEEWHGMDTLIYGAGEGEDRIEGIMDKLEKYNEKFGHYPETVVIDSVSQIFMDVIDEASKKPNVYGSQGAEVTKEMATLTTFIHEDLELNGVNVILLNHIIEEKDEGKPTGSYVSFGSGKFLSKGGFYSTTNESITVIPNGEHRRVYFNTTNKQARTVLKGLPEYMWVENSVDPEKSKRLKDGEEYFTLKKHMDRLLAEQVDVEEWSI